MEQEWFVVELNGQGVKKKDLAGPFPSEKQANDWEDENASDKPTTVVRRK